MVFVWGRIYAQRRMEKHCDEYFGLDRQMFDRVGAVGILHQYYQVVVCVCDSLLSYKHYYVYDYK